MIDSRYYSWRGETLKKILGMFLLVAGVSAVASAAITAAPEIDPASGTSALALLSGAVLVFRGRRRK